MVVYENLSQASESYIDESMMFWFHCNNCYAQPKPGRVLRFFITNCSHIFCDDCIRSCTKQKCKVCHTECTTLELCGKLPPEIERLFSDPVQELQGAFKKMQGAIQGVSQILEFQKSHQRRMCRHFLAKSLKEDEQKKELASRWENDQKEKAEMKKQIQYFKCLLYNKTDPHARTGSKSSSNGGTPGFSGSPSNGNGRPSPYARYQLSVELLRIKIGPQIEIWDTGGCQTGTSHISNHPGRILMRTPPSGGHIGTANGSFSYTPISGTSGDMKRQTFTPLSIPRPICFNNGV